MQGDRDSNPGPSGHKAVRLYRLHQARPSKVYLFYMEKFIYYDSIFHDEPKTINHVLSVYIAFHVLMDQVKEIWLIRILKRRCGDSKDEIDEESME